MILPEMTLREMEAVSRIADRARGYKAFLYYNRLQLMMDLVLAHKQIPIDFEKLDLAPPYDFVHDVGGIQKHLNRKTGELEDCFVPRYAKQQ